MGNGDLVGFFRLGSKFDMGVLRNVWLVVAVELSVRGCV